MTTKPLQDLLQQTQRAIRDLQGAIRMGERAMLDFPDWKPFDLEELRVTLYRLRQWERFLKLYVHPKK